MSEHFEHNLGDHEDPIPVSTWLVGAVGTVLLIVIIFGLTALYYNAQMRDHEVKVIMPTPFDLERYHQRQQRRFVTEPTWVERIVAEQRVRALAIPLDQAMDEVIREFGGDARQ